MSSARVLDRQRLGKQRLEALWMIRSLSAGKIETVSRMWSKHIDALCLYTMIICREWRLRGYKDNLWEQAYLLLNGGMDTVFPLPPWLGMNEVHSSHRAALLFKDNPHYTQFGWSERPRYMGYHWPKEEEYQCRPALSASYTSILARAQSALPSA
jgi:hypothetical protein